MPRFTLIKHAEGPYDAEVKVDFQAEVLDLARAHYEDFLQASGFSLPTKVETTEKWLERAEDAMWNDAFDSKFRNDGPVGSAGADIIQFPY